MDWCPGCLTVVAGVITGTLPITEGIPAIISVVHGNIPGCKGSRIENGHRIFNILCPYL